MTQETVESSAPCTCCGLEPGTYSSRILGPLEHCICYRCFLIWYEGGIVNQVEIKRMRLAEQAEANRGEGI